MGSVLGFGRPRGVFDPGELCRMFQSIMPVVLTILYTAVALLVCYVMLCYVLWASCYCKGLTVDGW